MREGITNKGGGYRAEKKNRQRINEHIKAPEKGHREVWGFERNETSAKRATAKRHKTEMSDLFICKLNFKKQLGWLEMFLVICWKIVFGFESLQET